MSYLREVALHLRCLDGSSLRTVSLWWNAAVWLVRTCRVRQTKPPYQQALGLDTNERTFKSLGLNGGLVSDTVGQLNNLFPDIRTSLDAGEIVSITKELLSMPPAELQQIKDKNKADILANHCYTNRIEQLVKL